MMAPVLKQARSLGSYFPVVWVRDHAPLVHKSADGIDRRGQIVLLGLGRQPFAFVQDHCDLPGRPLAFLWLGDRGDKLGAATAFHNPLRGLTRVIEFPMSHRVLVGRIEDRLLEESIIYARFFSSMTILQLMAYPVF